MDAKDLIISTSAIVGALLGVFNLWRSYLADSERLRVSSIEGGQHEHPGIEVVNVSPFPITVLKIGYVAADGQVGEVVIEVIDSRNDPLPKRIDARHAHHFRISMRETIARNVYQPRYTFVRTALGGIFTDEPRLTRWWRRARERVRLKNPDL